MFIEKPSFCIELSKHENAPQQIVQKLLLQNQNTTTQ
ncbi:unnamed protein product [Paramecium primaurelia]|uniref:Uncharacterized protein n=1 Tax=Paramecium primaurelia TaxID=5886 RepID=A0A8S1LK60_PARPR|nr:unnamed protein product [Paramecium primaurelia]